MTDDVAKDRKPAVPAAMRQPYRQPTLKVYGTVAEFTKGSATVGNDGINTRKNPQSDPATKENIVCVGQHPMGFGLYLFDYKPEFRDRCGHERQFGVMADEIAALMPEAVGRNADGFLTVDYAKLGIIRH